MTSLLDRDPTPEDLEAERDPPRPGVWAGESGADLRALTQDETDQLIRVELYWGALGGSTDEQRRELSGALGGRPSGVKLRQIGGLLTIATRQRGGIDSDPLVRVLARRAWGDRDRRWFELRGVRQGDVLTPLHGGVSAAWPGEFVLVGVAEADACPGQLARTEIGAGCFSEPGRVSDRLREPPAWSKATPDEILADIATLIDRQREFSHEDGIRGLLSGGLARWSVRDGAPWGGPGRLSTTGTLPPGLSPGSDYWIVDDDPDRLTIQAVLDDRNREPFGEQVVRSPVHTADYTASHRPGARDPGHRPSPPVPRWARKRAR